MRRRLVTLLFIATGASGLVFEILWVKQLTLVVSSTTFAVSLTVSIFLAGLMLGSELSGRLARTLTRPLRAYAIAELLAGALASAVTLILPHLPGLCATVGLPGGGPLVVRTLIVAAFLLPPTLAMGATLPLLSRYIAADDARVGADVGTLYTLNTLGAAAGCGLGGFIAISLLGVMQTSLLASAVNAAVGAVALFLAKDEQPTTPAPAKPGAGALGWLEGLFFLSGFAAIAYEVLWFRVLSTFFDATTYAFTLLLCTFLFGLVLGGALSVRRFANHPRPLEALAGLQAGIALAALIAFVLMGVSPGISRAAHEVGSGPWGFVIAMAIHALVIILPPAVLIGAVFPLVVQLGTQRATDAGPRVGRLYAVNTLGGILGSALVGFVLIPAFGTQLTYTAVCLLSMGLALWVQRRDPETTRRARVQLGVVAAIVAAGLLMPPRDFWTHAQVATPDATLLSLTEGRDGTLSVSEYTRESVCASNLYRCDASCPAFEHRKLQFGAISYASTVLPARRYMRFLAHIGMLLRPKARDVLEVCFGTGTTAGAFASHPSLRSLTLVDLNPDVFAQAKLFEAVNHGALEDSRAHRVVDDGRHFLLSTEQRFDVVSFEPPPPRAAGVVNLYSRDFYALVKAKLNPQGVVTQWIPLDQQSSRLDRALVKSLSDVFAHVSIYLPSRLHGIIVASDAPLDEDLAAWATAMESPGVKASLLDVGFENAQQVHATLFAREEQVKAYTGDVPAVTDDRPSIEHFLFEWDKPFEVEDLLAVRANEAGPEWEAEGLRALAAQAARHRNFDEAKRLSLEADEKLPGNPYGAFLRELEYRCLVPR